MPQNMLYFCFVHKEGILPSNQYFTAGALSQFQGFLFNFVIQKYRQNPPPLPKDEK
jgi:hypothetical protein